MEFTYKAYRSLLKQLESEGYTITNFAKADDVESPKAIMRHDIDVSIKKAEKLARIEHDAGIKATYFVMLRSPFYNILNREEERMLFSIIEMGHEIGLHSETPYSEGLPFFDTVIDELQTLSEILCVPVESVSWHIPTEQLVGKRIEYLHRQGIRNAYDPIYVKSYKYCSDSMMRWRDKPETFINPDKTPRLCILTHPVWYSENGGKTANEMLRAVIKEKHTENERYLKTILPDFSV